MKKTNIDLYAGVSVIGGCNIGLYGKQPSIPVLATPGLSSWKNVHTAGVELLNKCLMKGVGGSIDVKSCMLPL